MYPRNAIDHLKSLFAAFPVVVVTGARQVGKTTLLRQLFPKLTMLFLMPAWTWSRPAASPICFSKITPRP